MSAYPELYSTLWEKYFIKQLRVISCLIFYLRIKEYMVAGPEWLEEPLGSKVQTSSLLKLEGKAELLVINISNNMVIENGR